MKVYIAGKITGDSAYREKFQQAQRDLEGEGLIVLNPAGLPEGMRYLMVALVSDESPVWIPDDECEDAKEEGEAGNT